MGHGDTQVQWQPKEIEAFADQRVVAASAAWGHNLALTADGAVWSWGYADDGRLGHGPPFVDELLPKKIEAFVGQRVLAVSAGCDHSLALTADGAVWSWGWGAWGRLGHGDERRANLPKKVEALAGRRVVFVSAGDTHNLVITADGAVWRWGTDLLVYDGNPSPGSILLLPNKVQAISDQRVVFASAGGEKSFALTAEGDVWSWGSGKDGQLGHGDLQDAILPKKITALEGRRVVAISAGAPSAGHNLALTADGATLSWGRGRSGCLGHGEDLSDQPLPKQIVALDLNRAP